jgi:hypothetical protein
MAKTKTPPVGRRAGTSKLHGIPLDDDGGAILSTDSFDAVLASGTLAPTEPDQEFVATAGRAVVTFLKGLGEFFLQARTIETKAKQTLGIAQELQKIGTPKTQAADEGVQLFIKTTNEQKKAAEALWSITTVVHGFHRRLTARRAVATDAIEQANAIANKLHNDYVDTENRRIAREADERRRALEAEERRKRDEEAAAAAKEAERLEAAAPTVSAREQAFINYYLADTRPGREARAASLAGFKDPAASAQRLLTLPKILTALEARRAADEVRQQAAAKAQAPISVDVPVERPRVSSAAGLSSRTRWGATVLDAGLLTDAVFVEFGTTLAAWIGKPVDEATVRGFLKGYAGQIPRDVLAVDESIVRKYGESLHEAIDRWPGVVHTKNTKGV